MKYLSTRNSKISVSPSQAIVSGPSYDGGLFIPEKMPNGFPFEVLAKMSDYEISAKILSMFFDDFSYEELYQIVRESYADSFKSGCLAPLRKAGEVHFAELFHGPTCAFKDIALSVLPRLLVKAKQKCGVNTQTVILTATSGDTGSSAMYGFRNVTDTRIIVFYPSNGISKVQRRQMICCKGDNVTACGCADGNFDDTQTAVKSAFRQLQAQAHVGFSSANSINIGRLIPQIAYYFTAYRDLINSGDIAFGTLLDFVVPTGNFGDVLAGWFAKRIGLPIGKLICASNANNVLCDFFSTGVYDKRRSLIKTTSPSMDILISSNLERLISLYFGAERTAELFADLAKNGYYKINRNDMDLIRADFDYGFAMEDEASTAINDLFTRHNYLIDPHTAVGYAVLSKHRTVNPTVVLSTASPYKFAQSVLSALSVYPKEDKLQLSQLSAYTSTPIPDQLSNVWTLPVLHNDEVNKADILNYILKKENIAL